MRTNLERKKIICLFGPTATGKTDLAVELVKRFPLEIISVDSALIYKGMDIGTGKPSQDVLDVAPHRLIDICSPLDSYSVANFISDAKREIESIHSNGKTPILVGGTMMYFKGLLNGINKLPETNSVVRDEILKQLECFGINQLHSELFKVDPISANKLHPNDTQRVLRALEVYKISGKPMSSFQQELVNKPDYDAQCFALLPENDKKILHKRIENRFDAMLEDGFIDEVKGLHAVQKLDPSFASIKSVGYRQAWEYLDGSIDFTTMREKAVIATRQLAKRQVTWLRSWEDVNFLNCEDYAVERLLDQIIDQLAF